MRHLQRAAALAAALLPTLAHGDTMRDCTASPLARSFCMIETILTDIETTYSMGGGGGISSILQDATDVYIVSIAEEGQTNILTYRLDLDDAGAVQILEKTTDAKVR